jgi:glycosyltransferase involved in cell wall biosynthesis
MLNPARASERDRLSALFTASTCFVLPSLHEPAGIVHSEAGQAGVGSIGSTSGGAATLIGDGGLLVAPGDIDGVVRAMVTFTDPLRAQRFGARARARAALFSWDRVAGRLVRALGLTAPGSTELPLFL